VRKALVVGINNYPKSPLAGCINDAMEISKSIEKNFDGSPNFSVITAMDVQTKSELKTSIVKLFEGTCDVALLYFSGHGFINEIGGYIFTPDHKKYDEGVSMDEVLTLANNSKVKDKIIILDCCNSGAFGSPSINDGTKTHISEGVSILTASRSDESAVEEDGHGLFTRLLISALDGGAADLRGNITPGSIYSYIDQALGPWEQRPVFKTNVTRFTSIKIAKPPIDQNVLRKIPTYFKAQLDEYKLNPSYEDTNPGYDPENAKKFKELQKLQSVGLVVPVDAPFMYFAAMETKSCKLTVLGRHYWKLAKDSRI
jgi:hypothetical protein